MQRLMLALVLGLPACDGPESTYDIQLDLEGVQQREDRAATPEELAECRAVTEELCEVFACRGEDWSADHMGIDLDADTCVDRLMSGRVVIPAASWDEPPLPNRYDCSRPALDVYWACKGRLEDFKQRCGPDLSINIWRSETQAILRFCALGH